MKISEILKGPHPSYSFEFFPPKTDEDIEHLLGVAETLKELKPTYISVTWGAGGSTRRKTIDIVSRIKSKLNIETMAHLTCVGASQKDIEAVLLEIHDRGIENVLALRGDPPKGDTHFVPHPDGFRYANELVQCIRSKWNFSVGIAGYPEGHPETPDLDKDIDNLKRKVDAGGDFIVTQLFFNNDRFFRFVEKVRAKGISVPIIPGIMPVTNVNQIKKFTNFCGAEIPKSLLERLESVQEDKEAVIKTGIDFATNQCAELLQKGAKGIHFYTLNRSRSTAEILKNIRGRNTGNGVNG